MATTTNGLKNNGEAVSLMAILEKFGARLDAMESGKPDAAPTAPPAETNTAKPAAPRTVETRSRGKVTNVSDAAGKNRVGLAVENIFGPNTVASIANGKLNIQMDLVSDGHQSSTGKSIVHTFATLKLSDGSKVTLNHYTPTKTE